MSTTRCPAFCPKSGVTPPTPEIARTLVRHPKLTRAFLRFNVHLLYGSPFPHACVNWPFCGSLIA